MTITMTTIDKDDDYDDKNDDDDNYNDDDYDDDDCDVDNNDEYWCKSREQNSLTLRHASCCAFCRFKSERIRTTTSMTSMLINPTATD